MTMDESLVLTREQILTILFELKTTSEHWPEIQKWYPGQTFEEGVERFCLAARVGRVNGWCYFGDDCGCFYGHLSPQMDLDPSRRKNSEITGRASRVAEFIFVKMYGEDAIDEEILTTKTYIEDLLSSKGLGVAESTTIFEHGYHVFSHEHAINSRQFLRELYCLCYPYCSQAWQDTYPHDEDLLALTLELQALTKGAKPGLHCFPK